MNFLPTSTDMRGVSGRRYNRRHSASSIAASHRRRAAMTILGRASSSAPSRPRAQLQPSRKSAWLHPWAERDHALRWRARASRSARSWAARTGQPYIWRAPRPASLPRREQLLGVLHRFPIRANRARHRAQREVSRPRMDRDMDPRADGRRTDQRRGHARGVGVTRPATPTLLVNLRADGHAATRPPRPKRPLPASSWVKGTSARGTRQMAGTRRETSDSPSSAQLRGRTHTPWRYAIRPSS